MGLYKPENQMNSTILPTKKKRKRTKRVKAETEFVTNTPPPTSPKSPSRGISTPVTKRPRSRSSGLVPRGPSAFSDTGSLQHSPCLHDEYMADLPPMPLQRDETDDESDGFGFITEEALADWANAQNAFPCHPGPSTLSIPTCHQRTPRPMCQMT